MSDELKPCPWCGSPAVLIGPEKDFPNWLVTCHYGRRCEALPSVGRERKEDAVASWNTRPAEDALLARIAELEAQLADR